jgi:hypothetical protein
MLGHIQFVFSDLVRLSMAFVLWNKIWDHIRVRTTGTYVYVHTYVDMETVRYHRICTKCFYYYYWSYIGTFLILKK